MEGDLKMFHLIMKAPGDVCNIASRTFNINFFNSFFNIETHPSNNNSTQKLTHRSIEIVHDYSKPKVIIIHA